MRLLDFNLVKERVVELMNKKNISSGVALDFFASECLFGLDSNQAEAYITDSEYIKDKGNNHDDRGIDVLFLDQDAEEDELVVNLVSCKFKENFETAKVYNFPTTELSKLESSLNDLTEDPIGRIETFNIKQRPLIEEIGLRYENSEQVYFKVYLCTNGITGIDKKRFKNLKDKFSEVEFILINCDALVEKHIQKAKPKIDSKIVISKTDKFDIGRGFVAQVNASELLRLFSKNSEFRIKTEFELLELKNDVINEAALKDNVRKFKGVNNEINKNIISTAKTEDECDNFFYYNNGITILCDKIKKSSMAVKQPITLEGMQIVNGGQTIRCLDTLREDNLENLENIKILCRFYETGEDDFSTKVAEYTNSQTAVTTRDIKSVDEKQRKLQTLVNSKGYYYQIKAKEFEGVDKEKIIDMEKIAQCIYAYNCECPSQARNNKKEIFLSKYNEIFNDSITAETLIGLFKLFKQIVQKRNGIIKQNILDNTYNRPEYGFIMSSDYFMLYGMKKLYVKKYNKEPEDLGMLIDLYGEVYLLLQKCVIAEKERREKDGKLATYSNSSYFKNSKLKDDLDLLILNYPEESCSEK